MRHKRFHRTLLFTFMMGILAFLLFRSPVKAAPPALPRTPIIPTIVFTPPPPTATPTRLPLPPVPPPELKDPPTAPTNLRIEAEEEDLIVVSWDDNSANEQGFKVYYRQPSADTWQIQESESAYRIFIGNLSADTEYCFQATAYNEDGESPPSNQDCGLTDLAPPSHFRAYNVTSTSVTLTWADNANRETSYDLVRVRIPGGNYHRIEFEPQEGGAFTYTDSGLEPDTEYQYYVSVARAPDGDDPYGDNWARTESLTVKTQPTGGDAQAELAFNGSLTLSPVFPDPFEAFTITWVVCNPGGTASGEFTDVARLDEKTTFERSIPSVPPNGCYERSASHPGLPPGHHYWYVYLDAHGDVDEAYEGNNVNYHGFTVPDSRFWINNP